MVLACIQDGTRSFDGVRENRAELGGALLYHELSAGDPRHIEEVVQQSGHVGDLPLDDLFRARMKFGFSRALLRRCQSIANRREGITQLVRQHRQELILLAIGYAEMILELLALGYIVDRGNPAA